MKVDFIVLAAGKGKRMGQGHLPKVLLPLAGRPIAQHLLDTISSMKEAAVRMVVGYQASKVKSSLKVKRNTKWVIQKNQLGTAHAVKQAVPLLRKGSIAVVLYGDVPLVSLKTIKSLIRVTTSKSIGVLTFQTENPKGYGRIIRDNNKNIATIIEERDASLAEKAIKEVNSGIISIHSSMLGPLLKKINNKNAAKEYYLTDIVSTALKEGISSIPLRLDNGNELLGANTPLELHNLERIYQTNLANKLINGGIGVADSNRIDIRGSLNAGKGSFIDINNIFEGEVEIGKRVEIGPNCFIKNSKIMEGAIIKPNTVIEDSIVGPNSKVGPFARIRGGTKLDASTELGNFVEANRSQVGALTKAKHLAYLGDTTTGASVNIGAGTITCNYDGKNKNKTKLEDGVFVGSNTSIVAPVTLSQGSYTGAGSVITKNVPRDSLAIGRAKQTNIKRKRN